MRPLLTLHRVFWMASVCLLLLPRLSAAAEPQLAIDLNGDGHGDRVTLEHGPSSVLRVWLSGSDSTQVIRTRTPMFSVIATDLDGNRLPGLIASVEQGDKDSDDVVTRISSILALSSLPRVPAAGASSACTSQVSRTCRSFPAADAFAPRPPPTSRSQLVLTICF